MVHVRQRQGMPQRPGQGWSRGRIAAVAAGGVALLLAVGTGRAINRNRQVRAELVELQQRIEKYRAENQELAQNLDYLSSDAFIAAEARRSLGLGLPGEQPVVVVPPNPAAANLAASHEQGAPSLPSLWWRYFFGDTL